MRSSSMRPLAVVGLSLLSTATAQTSTSCDPTEKTCPSDEGLEQSTYTVDFTQGASSDWNMTYGSVQYDSTNGANFTISKSGDAPTMQSNFYIFGGSISVVMKTAPGTGIVTTAILESDDLDEVDWEFLGGETTNVQANYFSRGNTSTTDREVDITISDSQDDFHNYTLVWTKESLEWLVDGTVKRTLTDSSSLVGADRYPQTPMRIKLGIWAGGDSGNAEGTIQWAGGETDYSQGPFTAFIKSVSIVNYNPASSYTYGDTSGLWDSIEINTANSTTDSASSSSSSTSASASSSTGGIFATGVSSTRPASATGASNSTSSSSSSSGSSSSSSSSSSTSSSASSVVTAGAAVSGPSVLASSAVLGIMGLVSMLL